MLTEQDTVHAGCYVPGGHTGAARGDGDNSALLMVMLNGVLALHQALQGTLLGDYVLLQTAVPQIAGCVIAIVLTFLSVADLLLLQVLVAACAAIPALRALSRLQVAVVLRAE